jgi:hypothetical protein
MSSHGEHRGRTLTVNFGARQAAANGLSATKNGEHRGRTLTVNFGARQAAANGSSATKNTDAAGQPRLVPQISRKKRLYNAPATICLMLRSQRIPQPKKPQTLKTATLMQKRNTGKGRCTEPRRLPRPPVFLGRRPLSNCALGDFPLVLAWRHAPTSLDAVLVDCG